MSESTSEAPSDPDQKVAWLLCTELTTRITTQPLPLQDGDEATALQSVVDFFKLARTTIAQNPGCQRCAPLVLDTLNLQVRPFTARWHRQQVLGRLHSTDQRYRFRAELKDVQVVLGRLAERLAEIGGMPMPTIVNPDAARAITSNQATLPYGIPAVPERLAQTTDDINKAEHAEVAKRRLASGLLRISGDAVGLALSGGGIRSATFAQGVLQQLAKRNVLREVDFMSTVSGGGYLGSFISAHGVDALKAEQQGMDPVPMRHMRNHSRYLVEGGLTTRLVMLVVLVSGVLIPALYLAGLVTAVTTVLWLGHWFGVPSPADWPAWLQVAGAAGLVLGWMPPINGPMHWYYRHRLARTYITQGTVPCRQLPLADLNREGVIAPYHLINAALNVPSSKEAELRDRLSTHFMFSKHWSGSLLTGWKPTKELGVDLASAMTISAAAASPHMGTQSRLYHRLLSLLGGRLGAWLRWPQPEELPRWCGLDGLLYFLRELSGWCMDERKRYLNLSDGGHIENLGVYELLRRRCRYIIAIDGECDPEHHFGGLMTLVRMAQIDMGIRIEPDLADLRLNEQRLCNSHFVMARIAYPETEVHGLLLYVKLSMTGNESEFLRNYRREQPDFPHHSTAQQLYSETRFEAYRALGEHIGDELFAAPLVTPPDDCDQAPARQNLGVAQWFEQLERQLLPD